MNPDLQSSFALRLETVLTRRTTGAVRQAARFLLRLENSGTAYSDCLLLLKDSVRAKLLELSPGGANDAQRRIRDYAEESFHLIRAEFQRLHGKVKSEGKSFLKGTSGVGVLAHIDGSVRHNKAAASFVLYAGARELAVGVVGVEAINSAEAETHALLLAMTTALALGHKALRVFTDTEMIVDLLSGHSRLSRHPLGQKSLSLLEQFANFEVRVVPRMFNHRADALALLATSA